MEKLLRDALAKRPRKWRKPRSARVGKRGGMAVWGALVGDVLGVAGEFLGANAQNQAAKTAMRQEQRAAADAAARARQQQELVSGLNRGYLDEEGDAAAIQRALYYGDAGSLGAGAPSSRASAYGFSAGSSLDAATPDIQTFIARNPDLQRAWAGFSGKQKDYWGNDFDAYIEAQFRAAQAAGRWDAKSVAENADPGATGPGRTITQADVYGMIDANPLNRHGEEDYAATNQILDRSYADESDLYARERVGADDANAIRRREREGRAAADFAARTGYLTEADAARQRLLDRDKERADAYSNAMLAGTGLVGASGRTRADQQNALNDAYAQWYYGQQQAIYDPYSAAQTNLIGEYYDTDAYNRGRYFDQTGAALLRRNTGRLGAQSARAGNRAAAYGDFTGYLNNQRTAGQGARREIAAGGQYATNVQNNVGYNAGESAANAAYARANTQTNLYNNIGKAIGNAYGTFADEYLRNSKKSAYG